MAVTPITQRTQDSVVSVLKADAAFTKHAALEPGSCWPTRHPASAALHAWHPRCQLSQSAACTQSQSAACKHRRRQQVSHLHMVEAYVAQVQMLADRKAAMAATVTQTTAYKQPALMNDGGDNDMAAAIAVNSLRQAPVLWPSAPDLQTSQWSRDVQQLTCRLYLAGASRAAGGSRAVCQFPGACAPAPGTHAVR